MPIFGDFETVGEPVAVTEQSGHVSTVWRARKRGSDGDATHAVKCFAPARRKSGEGAAEDALDKDRGLEFLEGVKQLKKAQAEGGRCLSTIHAFGFADEGAWYVGDFYPRNTLKAWIARRGSVDSAGLSQVVHCIVTGCLALKKARGYSHGNLKAANVFLVGKPQPLRKAPLELADAYPAAPLQLARLAGQEKVTVDELLHQVMEVQDLRALGELLLQLVEGRLVASAYDYNYPIAATPMWERLGRDAGRWRELCNQLLDPRLSLDNISLESLSQEYRPSTLKPHLPKILAGAGAVCVILVGVYVGLHLMERGRERRQKETDAKVAALVSESKSALERNDFATAIAKSDEALRLKPDAPEATGLKTQAGEKLEAAYQNSLTLARAALTAGRFDEAEQLANQALQLKKGDKASSDLMKAAQTQRNARLSQAEQDRNYELAISAAQAALSQQNFGKAISEADRAMGYRANDGVAQKIKTDAEKGQKEALARAELERNYQQAMASGRTALNQKDYDAALASATRALDLRANDPAAQFLKTEAEAGLKAAQARAENDRKYERAMETGLAALTKNDFTSALAEAGRALNLRTNDAAALKLKSDAEAGQRNALAQVEQDRNYKLALEGGQAALDKKDYPRAIQEADRALGYRANDPAATQLKADAGARQKEAQAQAERDQNYRQAMATGTAALGKNDYTNALNQADIALSHRANDPAALKLKSDIGKAQANAVARAEQEKNYQQAMEAGKTALAANDFGKAIAEAERALEYRQNDADAKALRERAVTQQKEVANQAARAKNYQVAMTEATNAWNSAKTTYAGGTSDQYQTALTQIASALGHCRTARNNGDAKPVESLEAELNKFQAEVERKRDFELASRNYSEGNYDKALEPRSKYGNDPEFLELRKNVAAEQTVFLDASKRFAIGDYSFLTGPASSHVAKSNFKTLIANGRIEYQSLADLTLLTNQMGDLASFEKLKNGVAKLDASVAAKPPFAALKNLVAGAEQAQAQKREQLKATLDNELLTIEIQLNAPGRVRSGDVTVPGGFGYPNEGKKAEVLGAVSGKSFYLYRVGELTKKYQAAGLYDQRKELLASLTAFINKELID